MPKSPLLLKDDYWSIWLGLGLLIVGLLSFYLFIPSGWEKQHADLEKTLQEERNKAPYKTIRWQEALEEKEKLKGSKLPLGQVLSQLTTKPSGWKFNPLYAFMHSEKKANEVKATVQDQYEETLLHEQQSRQLAELADSTAHQAGYQNAGYNTQAEKAINQWLSAKEALSNIRKKYQSTAFNKWPWLLSLFLLFGLLFGVGKKAMGTPFFTFLKGFALVFGLAVIAFLLGAQANMKAIGFGYAAWAIILGLLISNTIGTPGWAREALSTEFYIKTGLVILGAEILLGKILAIGLPGIFVAWVVTPIVLVSTFWFGQKVLRISSKTLNMTISADMSVCGVSAAVATAAACKASKEELTIAIGLSMIFTSVMMILLPGFINLVGMPEVLGGAWIGGTIDATGAVVAAGAFLGETALSVAATIKMIQNVLIGLIAFGVAFYFATQVEKKGKAGPRVTLSEIWYRFPKFILGFLGASILFSIIYALLGSDMGYSIIDQGIISSFTKNLRGWLFCLAFVSIGLSINFKELKKHFTGGRPLILYICGQALNLCLTLLMAYVMFYLVFPNFTENI
jgi:uncharacterized membrane protein YadS